jgi:tetratricopeptide (TPR) repeat protein
MKILVAALVVLLLTVGAIAHSQVVVTEHGNPQDKSSAPELSEALRMSAAVVELFRERKYDEALPLAKKALELREKVLTKDDQLVIETVLNLAEVQYARRELDESKKLFERAVHSYERLAGVDDPRRAKVLERLGRNYHVLGKRAEAGKSYQESLAIREKLFGPEHSETARSVFNLAEFYQFEKQYKEAELLYRRLIEIQVKSATAEELIAQARSRYACLLRKTDRTDEAERIEGSIDAVRPKDQQSPVDSGILNRKATYLAHPRYPAKAIRSRMSGRVIVRVLISEKGDVISACGIKGLSEFMDAAESAAVVSKFTPTTLDGKPVKVNGLIIYNFVAQ